MPSPPDLLTVADVAEKLGKATRTVQRMARDGVIPARKLPGGNGAYLFEPAAIDTLVALTAARRASREKRRAAQLRAAEKRAAQTADPHAA